MTNESLNKDEDTNYSVSIVFPVFNEEDNISPLLGEIDEVSENIDGEVEIIAVDDGSTDSSIEVLEEESEKKGSLKVVKLQGNHGQSKALQAGIDAASGDYIVTMDSDMQNDPTDVPDMLERLKDSEHDVIAGRRQPRKDPFGKKVTAKIASRMRLMVFDIDSRDYGCTLKSFKNEAAKSLSLTEGMHRYIPVLVEMNGFSLSEMEVNHRERYSGETKYGFSRIPKGFSDMVKLWIDVNMEKSFFTATNNPFYRIERVIK